MQLLMNPREIGGLTEYERATLAELISVYDQHKAANAQKNRYYEGNISLGEVNLGIAIPQRLRGLEIG